MPARFDELARRGKPLSATKLNEVHEAVKRAENFQVEGDATLTGTPSGMVLSIPRDGRIFAIITAQSSNGFHSWEERRLSPKGNWIAPDCPRKGRFDWEPAKEINGASATVGSIVEMRPGGAYTGPDGKPANIWLFQNPKNSTGDIVEPFRVIDVNGGSSVIQTIDGKKTARWGNNIYTPEIWYNLFQSFRPTVFGFAVFPSSGDARFGTFLPFMFEAYVNYYGSYSTGDVVTLAGSLYGQPLCDAFDPLQLIRANGYRGRALIGYGSNAMGSVSFYPYGSSPFTVINARATDAYLTGGGIGSPVGGSLSGATSTSTGGISPV